MIVKAFAVYDTKALVYQAPFFNSAVGVALRMFSDAVNDPQTFLNKHPTDYILFEVGTFDDNTGEFITVTPPKNLGLASDFLDTKPRLPEGVYPVNAVTKETVQ